MDLMLFWSLVQIRFLSSSNISNPTDFINLQLLLMISTNEAIDGTYVELGLILGTLSKLTRRPRGGGQQANFYSEGLKAK